MQGSAQVHAGGKTGMKPLVCTRPRVQLPRAIAPAAATQCRPVPAAAAAQTAVVSHAEDKFIARNLTALQVSSPHEGLSRLHASSRAALTTLRMPTTRVEDYRFTDISPLTKSQLVAPDAAAAAAVDAAAVSALLPPEAAGSALVLLDGVLARGLSDLSTLPAGGAGSGVYVGGADGAPAHVMELLGRQSGARGGPFDVLNGAAARDVLVVSLPAGTVLERPIYVLHLASGLGGGDASLSRPLSAPRLLVHLGQGAAGEVVEEYAQAPLTVGSGSGANGDDGAVAAQSEAPVGLQGAGHQQHQSFTCSLAEVFLEQDSRLTHSYVEREGSGAVHVKGTLVAQAAGSSYGLTEVRLGGGLTRHDLGVQQEGAATATEMRHFVLAGPQQLHDLHTRLSLDHPDGKANQLHKCIVADATARGVFDGNVQVHRAAQRTDAGQLSRNLLLAPRATVNVKPNLQIVADDVKCTHGCAVSDLSEEELFYFRARGINAAAARQALVRSFGAEVVARLKYPSLTARVQADVSRTLQQQQTAVAVADS